MTSARLRHGATIGAWALLLPACLGKVTSAGSSTPVDPVLSSACGSTVAAGHTMIHRLDNTEYNNTVRDLVFTKTTPADTFASSSVGSTGFENQSDVLTLSDQLVTNYAQTAIALADEVLASKGTAGGAYAQLAGCAAGVASPTADCVKSVVQTFLQRAFRRTVDDDDLARLMTVYAGESTFDDGFHDVIVATLIDPLFLFSYIKHPSPDDPTVTAPLDSFEIASRLSYAIWESMPDDTLWQLASQDKLNDPDTILAQLKRLLADPKATSFATAWRRDWAKLTLLDGTAGYGGLPSSVTDGLRDETQSFIADMIANDRSFLTLVNGDQTFVNKDVAAYYGWNVPAATGTDFVRTPIPDMNRRGVLTQAAMMLTIGGGESYTHPVQRGRWVMDALLCAAPPAPPPGVPSLDTDSTDPDATMRVRLDAHVSNPNCIGCHQVMDVYGLGLENFDLTGKWRDTYPELNNAPVDASGQIPGGASFTDPSGMIAALAADPQVQSCLTQKLMSYVLTRPMASSDDECVATAIGSTAVTPTSKMSDLFSSIVKSPQFLSQQGVSP